MSSGFTDSLVLTLPVYWWPSFTTLQEYPVTAERTLAAAIARFPASLGAPAVELSRLGVTVFHLAEWNEDTTHVLVYDPFTGETVALPVSLADSKGVLQGKGRPSLPQLARQGRIRVQPMPLDMEDRKKRKTNTNDRTTRQILSDCLFDNYYKVLLGHIQLATRQSVPLGSIIVTGNPSHTKCMVRHVTENAPTLFSVPSQDSGAWVTFVVEHRVLDLSLLFRMDEREALAAVRATLRLPPIPPSQQSTARHCLLVEMHGIDRLDTTAVTHTAVIISEILAGCHRIEEKQHNPHCCVFFLSTAQYVQEVHPTLCSRLGKSLLALTPPTVEECKQCLEKLLSPDELDALTQTPERWRWIALRMSTTLRIEELLELNPTTLRTWMTEALDRYASAQEMHSAAAQDTHYGHLYGVGPCIASLERLLVWPLAHLTELQELGIPTTKGALLCGPTGCGKTVVMTALARRLRELQVNFTLNVIIVDGLSLIEKEVGKTEKNISQLFQKARSRTPTVLFIDNLDALAPPRGQLTSETNLVADRSLSTLLTEMDGVTGNSRQVVIVVASAPSLEVLDPAVYRPGRLDIHVSLDIPSVDDSMAFTERKLHEFVDTLAAKNVLKIEKEEELLPLKKLITDELEAYYEPLQEEAPTAATVLAAYREVMLEVLSVGKGEEETLELTLSEMRHRIIRGFEKL